MLDSSARIPKVHPLPASLFVAQPASFGTSRSRVRASRRLATCPERTYGLRNVFRPGAACGTAPIGSPSLAARLERKFGSFRYSEERRYRRATAGRGSGSRAGRAALAGRTFFLPATADRRAWRREVARCRMPAERAGQVGAEESTPLSGTQAAERLVTDGALRDHMFALAWDRFRIDRSAAEDLLQEAAVELIRSGRPILRPDGFALRVFHSRCCRYVERQATRRRLLSRAAPTLPGPKRIDASGTDMALALRQGLGRLSPTCQRLLREHYCEGRTLAETAQKLSKAESGISTLVSRCLDRLRSLMACARR